VTGQEKKKEVLGSLRDGKGIARGVSGAQDPTAGLGILRELHLDMQITQLLLKLLQNTTAHTDTKTNSVRRHNPGPPNGEEEADEAHLERLRNQSDFGGIGLVSLLR